MPETIRSGRSPTRPRSPKRTQSTGVPSVAKPVVPSRSSTSRTVSDRWIVMLRAEPLRFESGAMTETVPWRSSATFASNRPRDVMPSSLVSRMCTGVSLRVDRIPTTRLDVRAQALDGAVDIERPRRAQPIRRIPGGELVVIARPRPQFSGRREPSPDRVERQVPGQLSKVVVRLDGHGHEAVAYGVAGSPMTGVEAFRIERVEPLHPARERSRSANQKMPVGVHEAVRPDVPSVEFRGVAQQAE